MPDPFCPACGTEVDEDARFCPTCGRTLAFDARPEDAEPTVPGQADLGLPPEATGEPEPDEPAETVAIPPAPAWPPVETAAEPDEASGPPPVAAERAEPPTAPPPATPPPVAPPAAAAMSAAPPEPGPATAEPWPATAPTRREPDLPFSWPATLAGWLIGAGSFFAALSLLPRLGNPLDLLLFLALLAITASVFLADRVPTIPRQRLVILLVLTLGLGVALERAAFTVRGLHTIFLIAMLVAAGGALLIELDRDRPVPPPGGLR